MGNDYFYFYGFDNLEEEIKMENKKGFVMTASLVTIIIVIAFLIFFIGPAGVTAWKLLFRPTMKLTGWQIGAILVFVWLFLRMLGSNKK